MKFIKSGIIFLFVFVLFVPALAQVDTAWVRSYDGLGNGNDEAKALVVDDSGNVYVTGRSLGVGTFDDYLTIKYSPGGDTLWSRSYNGLGDSLDVTTSIAVDNNGNAYVTGYTWNGSSDDYTTIKYNPTGDTLWVRNYNGPGNGDDQANDLAVDNSGNVYITGNSRGIGTFIDFATIKYAPAGDTLWVRRYDGPAGGNDDGGVVLALDDSGRVYASGFSKSLGTGRDYLTVKYLTTGDSLWTRRYDGPGNGVDEPKALAVDNSGNLYLTGFSKGTGTDLDYATIKYNLNGDTIWLRRYNGIGNGEDVPNGLVIDNSGNVYVAGYSWSGTSFDYSIIKYYPNGDTGWVRTYNGSGDSTDVATALALDNMGNVYVTGYSWNGSSYDYLTIKYNSIGDTVWTRSYNGTGNGEDVALAVSVDKFINVYVGGYSWNGTSYDYLTIKNPQYICLAKSGDANNDNQILLSDIVRIINFLFKGAPAPVPYCRGDVNASGTILLSDIVYLVNFLFKSGPAPVSHLECCL